ncbi:hypothetical protein COO60DRAFT_1531399, partial [Scenedesmus sp. NREL 46B-D3]
HHTNCPSVYNRRYITSRITGGLCAGLLLLGGTQPAQAAVSRHSQLVLLDTSNTAVLQSLKQLNKAKDRFGSQAPPAALNSRFMGATQQLQRIELLVKINQYDNARMALRQGSFQSLRMDLGYGQEMYRVVKPQVVREVIDGVEQLDQQLKRREAIDIIKPRLQTLQDQLSDLATLMADVAN